MNAEHVCEELEITRDKLDELIEDGLPWYGSAKNKRFDEEEVVCWLLENDRAEVKNRRFVDTHREIAEALGLRQKTVEKYRGMGMPGDPGAYDLDEIEEWIEEKTSEGLIKPRWTNGKQQSKDESSVLDELRRHKLEQMRSQLIHIDEVKQEAVRQKRMFERVLPKLPDKIESRLPDGLDASVVAIIRETTTATVDAACEIVADLGKGVIESHAGQ